MVAEAPRDLGRPKAEAAGAMPTLKGFTGDIAPAAPTASLVRTTNRIAAFFILKTTIGANSDSEPELKITAASFFTVLTCTTLRKE
jgi:hypothetical protein